MDVDVFLWQHVSRPCVLGEGKRRGRQRENTLFLFFFFPLLPLVWSVLLFSVLLLP